MPVLLTPEQAPDLNELVEQLQAQVPGLVQEILPGEHFDATTRIQGVGSLEHASNVEISFIVSDKYAAQLKTTQACAVVMPPALAEADKGKSSYAIVVCDQPYLFYALVAGWFEKAAAPLVEAGVHPRAVVSPDAVIQEGVTVGPNAVIGAGTHLHEGAQIGANCVIGRDCIIGQDTIVYPNVSLYDRVRVGARCIIHSGVVLGADGFGFAPNPMAGDGAWGKIAQLGSVRIGDDVEIGANTTIDRGALEDTVIGNGVKIDNQIMIGHNCQIGEHTAMAACVGVAGSTTIGARCYIGGAAMFAGHQEIVDDVLISGGTAVMGDIREPGRYTGVFPLARHGDWQKNAAVLGQLSALRRRLRDLERDRTNTPDKTPERD